MLERSLVLLKPDCVQRRLIGRIISRFEDKGLNLIAMKLIVVTPELARRHYEEHVEKPFYPGLEAYITGGPIVAMVIEGPEAIRVIRHMVGATNGLEAAAGTIRGDFGTSNQMNLVHASDGADSAVREIGIFFDEKEVVSYVPTIRTLASGSKCRLRIASFKGATPNRTPGFRWNRNPPKEWLICDLCLTQVG